MSLRGTFGRMTRTATMCFTAPDRLACALTFAGALLAAAATSASAEPARSFRVTIQNATASSILTQTFSHLCGGAWTPGGWNPPGTIAPGNAAGMQSESDGVATGTEGYAKYDVATPSGRQGMIYVYWDNPFYGFTHFRFAAAAGDIFPDCDFEPPPGGSTFPDAPALSFAFGMSAFLGGPDGGGDITNIGDFVNYAVGPVSLLGLVGIDRHPELKLRVSDPGASGTSGKSFGTFGDLGPTSLRLLTQATPEQWVGRWAIGTVSVTIAQAPLHQLSATVNDGTASPPVRFSEAFTPGSEALLRVKGSPVLATIDAQSHRAQDRAVLTRAAKTAITRSANQSATHAPPGPAASPRTGELGRVLDSLLPDKGGAAYLSHRVVLRLYGTFQSGQQTGRQLHFQRLNALGDPVTSVPLVFVPDIR